MLLIIVLFVPLFFIYLISKRSDDTGGAPFLPYRIPILGNITFILHEYARLHESFVEYGNSLSPVFRVDMFGEVWHIVTKYENVKKVLLTESDRFANRPTTSITAVFAHEGRHSLRKYSAAVNIQLLMTENIVFFYQPEVF